MILNLAWDVLRSIGSLTAAVVCGWFAFRLVRGDRLVRTRGPREDDVTALAKALFDVGLTSIGPDDLDNRQIASRLLAGDYVRRGDR